MPKMRFQNLLILELETIKMHYSSITNVYNWKNILSLWNPYETCIIFLALQIMYIVSAGVRHNKLK